MRLIIIVIEYSFPHLFFGPLSWLYFSFLSILDLIPLIQKQSQQTSKFPISLSLFLLILISSECLHFLFFHFRVSIPLWGELFEYNMARVQALLSCRQHDGCGEPSFACELSVPDMHARLPACANYHHYPHYNHYNYNMIYPFLSLNRNPFDFNCISRTTCQEIISLLLSPTKN